jgi:hypothetical protein
VFGSFAGEIGRRSRAGHWPVATLLLFEVMLLLGVLGIYFAICKLELRGNWKLEQKIDEAVRALVPPDE